MRTDKHNYYLDIAQAVSERSTCLRRKYGAVIVKNDIIVATGYNGAARGRKDCCEKGYCLRERENIPHGQQYEKCVSVHAEQNAIISASKEEMRNATLYLSCTDPETGALISDTDCCMMCKRVILNAGISMVIIRDTADKYRIVNVGEWVDLDE